MITLPFSTNIFSICSTPPLSKSCVKFTTGTQSCTYPVSYTHLEMDMLVLLRTYAGYLCRHLRNYFLQLRPQLFQQNQSFKIVEIKRLALAIFVQHHSRRTIFHYSQHTGRRICQLQLLTLVACMQCPDVYKRQPLSQLAMYTVASKGVAIPWISMASAMISLEASE